jgi:hypothetical protein
MSIENIINTWKADEDDQDTNATANPIGEELTDQELQQATGGFCQIAFLTCGNFLTCTNGITFCIQAPTA